MEPISVIIGFSNNEQVLKGCINSLIDTLLPHDEIILVVNSSSISAGDLNWLPSIVTPEYIDKPIGNARALNLGVELATKEYVVFCDFDLAFTKGWVDELFKTRKSSESHITGSVLINPQTGRVSECGIAYTKFNGAHPFQDLPLSHRLVSEDYEVQAICCGGSMISKHDFYKVGRFREDLTTMYMDVEFCIRARRKGLKIALSARSNIYHFGGWISYRDRAYKNVLLKGDNKGAFFFEHGSYIEEDLGKYYQKSIQHLAEFKPLHERYVFCNLMNVSNPDWYEGIIENQNIEKYDLIRKATSNRDSIRESLYDILGYEVMKFEVPIIYFVDRFISILDNEYWWENRDYSNDVVVDRNANIIFVTSVLEDSPP